MGGWRLISSVALCILVQSLYDTHSIARYNVWSEEAYTRFIENHSSAIFLTLNRPCNWDDINNDYDRDDNNNNGDEWKPNRNERRDNSFLNETDVTSDVNPYSSYHHNLIHKHLPMEPITSVLLSSHVCCT